jgi:hypothetical protein
MTPVLFRVWKRKGGGTFALLPTLPAGSLLRAQNADGVFYTDDSVMAFSRRATPSEAAPLHAALVAAGYADLVVYRKTTPAMHRARLAAQGEPDQ